MAGFFEEENGDRSMTRLVMFILTVLASAIVAVISVYALRAKPDAVVITALVGVLAALVLNGVVAIIKR